MKSKLTAWEWKALQSNCNLADGHAHQEQNKQQSLILAQLPTIFKLAEQESQIVLQDQFASNFFTLAGQKCYKKLPPPLYHYACSLAIEAVGNFLRLNNKSVAMIHPTFDNLADILKRHKLSLRAIEEGDLVKIYNDTFGDVAFDALFLVCPNNPTGMELNKKQFGSIVNFCKKNNVILILDFSFRFFSSYIEWDQYQILYKSGIDFVCLEDTGKTWPTLDIKIGTIISSPSLYEQLKDITNDFILNVSPFVFLLISKYIEVELSSKNSVFVKKVVKENREILKNIFVGSPLKLASPSSTLSVAWIKLPENWKASEFCLYLQNNKIFVLPGIPFFWADPKRGESYIRVALARPTEFFRLAVKKLAESAQQYQSFV